MKDITNYEGLYAITEEGQIWSYKSNRFLKPKAKSSGYLEICLSKKGEKKTYLIDSELPVNISKDEVNKIKEFSQKIRQESDVLLVCGIGGSYLGAKACLEMLKPYFKNSEELEVIFV